MASIQVSGNYCCLPRYGGNRGPPHGWYWKIPWTSMNMNGFFDPISGDLLVLMVRHVIAVNDFGPCHMWWILSWSQKADLFVSRSRWDVGSTFFLSLGGRASFSKLENLLFQSFIIENPLVDPINNTWLIHVDPFFEMFNCSSFCCFQEGEMIKNR